MPEGDALLRVARRLQVLVGERVEAESPNQRGLATGVARAVDGRVGRTCCSSSRAESSFAVTCG